MARILIVGCGCRGAELGARLAAAGHTVRGTTRHERRLDAIRSCGAEAVAADPGRLATLTPHLEGVSAMCWLMGSAAGAPAETAALHGPRLESMLEAIVDTPVRGFVYEGAGSVSLEALEHGAAAVRRAAAAYRMPVAVVEENPGRWTTWAEAMTVAVERVLSV